MNKDNVRRDVIRMVMSAIKQVEVDSQKTLTPEDVVAILQKEAKTRRESIDERQKSGQTDLAEQETAELRILETFMPEQLPREAIETLVREAIAASGATSAKDMGKVMGVLMPKVKGKADGSLVNQVVRELLGR